MFTAHIMLYDQRVIYPPKKTKTGPRVAQWGRQIGLSNAVAVTEQCPLI